jgi:hypothetical protein
MKYLSELIRPVYVIILIFLLFFVFTFVVTVFVNFTISISSCNMWLINVPDDVVSHIYREWLRSFELRFLDIAVCCSLFRNLFHSQLSLASKIDSATINEGFGCFLTHLYLHSGNKSLCFSWMLKRGIRATCIKYTGRMMEENNTYYGNKRNSSTWMLKRGVECADRLVGENNNFNEDFQYLFQFDLSHISKIIAGCSSKDDGFGIYVFDSEEDDDEEDFEDSEDEEDRYYRSVSNPFDVDEVSILINSCESLTELYAIDPMLTTDLVLTSRSIFTNLTSLRFEFDFDDVDINLNNLCDVLASTCRKLRSLWINRAGLGRQGYYIWKNSTISNLITANCELVDLNLDHISVSESMIRRFAALHLKVFSLECRFDNNSVGIYFGGGWSTLISDSCQLKIRFQRGREFYGSISHDIDTQALTLSVGKYSAGYTFPSDTIEFLVQLQACLKIIHFTNMWISTEMIVCIGNHQPRLIEIHLIDCALHIFDYGCEELRAIAVKNLYISQCKWLKILQFTVGDFDDNKIEGFTRAGYDEVLDRPNDSDEYWNAYNKAAADDTFFEMYNFSGFQGDCLIRREDGKLVDETEANLEVEYVKSDDGTNRKLSVRLSKSLLWNGTCDSTMKNIMFF